MVFECWIFGVYNILFVINFVDEIFSDVFKIILCCNYFYCLCRGLVFFLINFLFINN